MADHQYFATIGLQTKANLIATPSWNIENFTKQSDQGASFPWTIPDIRLTKRPKKPQVEIAMNGDQYDFGGWEFTWGFKYWTNGQFRYWMSITTIGTLYAETLRSTLMTVQTLMSGGAYEAFQCTYLLPIEGEHFTYEQGGIADLQLRFVAGTRIT
jgi:hypothetical protein